MAPQLYLLGQSWPFLRLKATEDMFGMGGPCHGAFWHGFWLGSGEEGVPEASSARHLFSHGIKTHAGGACGTGRQGVERPLPMAA